MTPSSQAASTATPLSSSASVTFSVPANPSITSSVVYEPTTPTSDDDDCISITSAASHFTRNLTERENSRALPNRKRRSPPSVHVSPPPNPPATSASQSSTTVHNRAMSKFFRTTDNLISAACKNESMVLWVNRGKSKYYLLYNHLNALVAFIEENAQTLDDGKVCLDEVCLQDLQKAKIDIDCDKSKFSAVSDDFREGGHVQMLEAVINAFSLALTSAHGSNVSPYDIVIYSSSRREKISCHLIYPEGRFPLYVCKLIAERTCSQLCRAFASFIDMQIYTKKHCFRLYGSCKFTPPVDLSSMKKKVSTTDLLDNDKIVSFPVDRTEQFSLLESLVTLRTSPALTFDADKFALPYGTRPRRTRCATSSQSAEQTSSSAFYSSTNLYQTVEKAASRVCGGDFLVRDGYVTCHKYVLYNVDWTSKGNCTQCKTVHDRDNASSQEECPVELPVK